MKLWDKRDGIGAKTAKSGMFLAFALVLCYVESLLPVSFGIPGVKLGLANLAVVTALYLAGGRQAFLIDLLRICLSGFLFGNLYSIFYSMAGGLCSFAAMWLCKNSRKFSIYGTSMAGGVFHNAGQLLVAAWVVETGGIFYYAPALLVAGILTGWVIGAVSGQMLKRLGEDLRE